MIPLTSNQIHNMATPRRGNLVHKLTANFRDPEQLYSAYSFRLLEKSLPWKEEMNELARLAKIANETPDNSAEL